ncbi:hypothetical protein N9O61_00795 [Octadecabacter sp.]|nr:hypothetical protein [Octadecabacter sp.]
MTYHTSTYAPFQTTPTAVAAACCLSLRDPNSDLLTREVLLLRDCIEVAKKHWGFDIRAAVILPAQMQMLGAFETGPYGIEQTLMTIQETFQRHLSVQDEAVWDGPADVRMLDWSAVAIRARFIEAAPVRARLVDHPCDWRFSTAFREGDGPEQGVAVA